MKAEYKTIDDLIKNYNKKYFHYSSYFVTNLDELYPNKEWINGDVSGILYIVNTAFQKTISMK